jgi:hypothetical protein
MRLGARLASTKFTLLSRRSTTGRAMDSEYLFRTERFLHGREIMSQTDVQECSILNTYRPLPAQCDLAPVLALSCPALDCSGPL